MKIYCSDEDEWLEVEDEDFLKYKSIKEFYLRNNKLEQITIEGYKTSTVKEVFNKNS